MLACENNTEIINNLHYRLLQHLCDELAYCCYLLRSNTQILHHTQDSIPDEGNYDACIISNRESTQNNDVLILQRDRLIGLINNCLIENIDTSTNLKADDEHPWAVSIIGDDENHEFTLVYTNHRPNHIPQDEHILFFPMLDYGEIPKASLSTESTSYETWLLRGNIQLARALWPFRIDYDGSCIALKSVLNVIICEISEK